MATIGIIGLGKMGHAMARHLLAAGHAVLGSDPVEAARDAAEKLGVTLRPHPRQVALEAELVFVVVGFDSEVETVIFGQDGLVHAARPGLTVGICSTVSPTYARKIERRLRDTGIVLLDLPSTRGEQAMEAGEVLILGGGDKVAFERWTPVLETFASDIFFLGPFGAGQAGKLVNNLILWSCIAANDEGLRLGEALGVAPDLLRGALHKSSAQNNAMSTRAEDRPLPWAEKDMMMVLSEADRAGMSLPLSGVIKEVIKGYKLRRGIPTPKSIE